MHFSHSTFWSTMWGVSWTSSFPYRCWPSLKNIFPLIISTECIFCPLLFLSNVYFVAHLDSGRPIDDEGVEDAFELLHEMNECVKTSIWVGDCFIYNNHVWRLNYCVGGKVLTIFPSTFLLSRRLNSTSFCFVHNKCGNLLMLYLYDYILHLILTSIFACHMLLWY